MQISMNMTDSRWDEERFRDGKDLEAYVRKLGLDGIELLHCAGGDPSFFPSGLIQGVHIRYRNDWLDLWQGNWKGLEAEYGSLAQAEKVLGGLDRDSLRKPFEEDLALAQALDVPYVVFHVCDIKTLEFFTYHFQHSDEQVVDAAAELINSLLDGKGYQFEFLMENLWWPGLTLTRPEITERLLSQVHYPRKGLMLDTGHLMHTNWELRSQEEAVDYIRKQVEAHGPLASFIRGMHLNQSLTGGYVRRLLEKREEAAGDYPARLDACYRHVFQIDQHLPFTASRMRELVEQVAPAYLTFELITSDRQEHEQKIRQQWEALR